MELNRWERQLEEHTLRGEALDLRDENELEKAALRGEALVRLAQRLVEEGVGRRGIRLTGAHVTGTLDFEYLDFGRPLLLEHCIFDMPPVFEQSHLALLSLTASTVPGMHAATQKKQPIDHLHTRLPT